MNQYPHDAELKQSFWKIELYVVTLSIVFVSTSFFIQGNVGLNLADEGHLWYGVIQTTQGAVPIRDFRAYDPGRYYWAAGWCLFFGSGILALRIANALFQIIGLSLGLLAMSKLTTNKWLLAFAGGLLVIWMFPRTKLYEHSLVMAAILFAVLIIENPSLKRHFIAGMFVGLAAFFGRNFGIYSFVSLFCLILFVWYKMGRALLTKRIIVWTLGIFTGSLPLIWMFVFVPGFFTSFLDSISLLFSKEAPVLPLPIPWPWPIQISTFTSLNGLRKCLVGLAFVIIPIFYLLSILYLLSVKKDHLTEDKALFIASVFIGVPLMHHAAVRSDVSHLAQSITPFLISLISFPWVFRGSHRKDVIICLLLGTIMMMSGVIMFPEIIPIVDKMKARLLGSSSLMQYDLKGDTVWISQRQVEYIESIKQFVHQHVASDESIMIVPDAPGMYPILERSMPIWDPFPLFPVGEKRQKQIIESLVKNNVNWALISNRAIDGMDERRFSKTHHIVWQYLTEEFVPIELSGLPDEQLLLQRNSQ
jgi:hypothetical protein